MHRLPGFSSVQILALPAPVSADRKVSRSRAVIIVLDPLDVAFAEITACLHFDQFKIDLAGTFLAPTVAALLIFTDTVDSSNCRRWQNFFVDQPIVYTFERIDKRHPLQFETVLQIFCEQVPNACAPGRGP